MQRIFKYDKFKISVLLLINSWTFWYAERLHMSTYAGVTKFKKWFSLLAYCV